MAHITIAADLGGSSLKVARFESGFRKLTLVESHVVEAPAIGRPEERIPRQLAALASELSQQKVHAEELVIGLPGDALSFRVLDLPFSAARQIEAVLGYELESEILTPVEELVLDFVIIGPARRGGESAGETRVLAAAAPRSLVEVVVRAAAELGLPLRTIGAAPLAYAALLRDEQPAPGAAVAEGDPLEGEDAPATLVLDVGAEHSDACIVRAGRPLMARTIARGGRHVSEAIGVAYRLDPAAAERAKIESGFVGAPGAVRLTPSQAHMDQAVRRAVAPLVRELRQTLASFRAAYGEGVSRLLLAGGGARLPGLAEHLGEELGIEVAPLPWPQREGWADVPADRRDALAVAVGMGLGLAHPTVQVNFRKGEYAYRSDFSFLRAKAAHLAVAAGLVIAFAGLDAWASYRGLRKEHDLLGERLKRATVEVFGRERDDLARISEELKEGPKASAQVPIPAYTAFDVLEEMSRAVPPPDKIRLDIEQLDMRSKKITIHGTTGTAQQTDDFTDALRKIECFEDVQKGKLVKRSVPPPPPPPGESADKKDAGPTELTEFSLTIKGSCP